MLGSPAAGAARTLPLAAAGHPPKTAASLLPPLPPCMMPHNAGWRRARQQPSTQPPLSNWHKHWHISALPALHPAGWRSSTPARPLNPGSPQLLQRFGAGLAVGLHINAAAGQPSAQLLGTTAGECLPPRCRCSGARHAAPFPGCAWHRLPAGLPQVGRLPGPGCSAGRETQGGSGRRCGLPAALASGHRWPA